MNRFNNFTVTEITGVYTPTYPEKEQLLMPCRPWYGLSVAIDGEIAYTYKGKVTVSDEKHMILLPMGASYNLNCYKPGRFTLVNFLCNDDFKIDEFLKIPITDAQGFINMHQKMEELYLFNTPGSRAELMSLLYSMVARLFSTGTRDGLYPLVRTGLKYMEENLENPTLSNKDMAKAAGVSEIYFRKLFKQSLGVSPHSYMREIRLNKAKLLLEGGNKSIDEIYTACGFSNVYYFFKVFKEKTGYTPTEYREKFYRKNF